MIGGTDWFTVVVGLGAFAALVRWKVGVVTVVLASGGLGLVWAWIVGALR